MVNATYIKLNANVLDVKELDLASGVKEAFIKVLESIRARDDFEYRFDQIYQELEVEDIDWGYVKTTKNPSGHQPPTDPLRRASCWLIFQHRPRLHHTCSYFSITGAQVNDRVRLQECLFFFTFFSVDCQPVSSFFFSFRARIAEMALNASIEEAVHEPIIQEPHLHTQIPISIELKSEKKHDKKHHKKGDGEKPSGEGGSSKHHHRKSSSSRDKGEDSPFQSNPTEILHRPCPVSRLAPSSFLCYVGRKPHVASIFRILLCRMP